jgi:hypothetical protein
VLVACKRPRESQGLAPGLSLSIIIDSRVKIIDNEKPGASPCDSRGRLHANNTPNENVKYEHGMWSRMLYKTIDFVLFACKRPRESQGLAPGFSLSIILTLLSMIIDNERREQVHT